MQKQKDIVERILELEKRIIRENKEKIIEDNRKHLIIILAISLLAYVVNLFITVIHVHLDGIPGMLHKNYLVFICMIIFFISTLHFRKKQFSTKYIYLVYFVGITYAANISAFDYPNIVTTSILAFLVQIPIFFIDRSWKIVLATSLFAIFYLCFIFPFKNPNIYMFEFTNVVSFTITSLLIGFFIRKNKLENYAIRKLLFNSSYVDELTNLPNRRKLFVDFKHERIDAIAILDIDFFKTYNDTFGHAEGDACLVNLSNKFIELSKKYSIDFYRYGGEEFVCLFSKYSREEILDVCNEIKVSANTITTPNITDTITISLGICFCEDFSDSNLKQLIHLADKALYDAKHSGRNQLKIVNKKDKD